MIALMIFDEETGDEKVSYHGSMDALMRYLKVKLGVLGKLPKMRVVSGEGSDIPLSELLLMV